MVPEVMCLKTTDVDGRVDCGLGHGARVTVEVRKVGFQPWTDVVKVTGKSVTAVLSIVSIVTY